MREFRRKTNAADFGERTLEFGPPALERSKRTGCPLAPHLIRRFSMRRGAESSLASRNIHETLLITGSRRRLHPKERQWRNR